VRENLLLRAAKGCYCFGQRFSNWSGGAVPFVHAYDRFGVDFDGVDFYQFWVKAVASGMKVPLEEFNLGAVAAKQAKYVVFDESSQTFSQASHGYHLSALNYIKAIAQAALAVGVKHSAGQLADVKVQNGCISAICLADGAEITADFYIDASGAEALLIKHLEQNNIQSWSKWLPANRIIVASALSLEPLPGFSQISAFKEGWVGLYPLLDRTAINIVYSSKHINSNAALEKVTALTGLKITDATEMSFSPWAREKHWIGNCLAVGSSAVSLEPLDATQLHLLHVGLSLLRSLLPSDTADMPEADIYNQKMRGFAENLRDYQAAHYHLNKRYGEPFWDAVRNVDIPAALNEKIKLFEARGIIPLYEDETFLQEDWIALFVGHNVQTKHFDPMVNKFADEELMVKFQQILGHIKNEVENMPSLQAQVEITLL
jgi:tryptophan halogenase